MRHGFVRSHHVSAADRSRARVMSGKCGPRVRREPCAASLVCVQTSACVQRAKVSVVPHRTPPPPPGQGHRPSLCRSTGIYPKRNRLVRRVGFTCLSSTRKQLASSRFSPCFSITNTRFKFSTEVGTLALPFFFLFFTIPSSSSPFPNSPRSTVRSHPRRPPTPTVVGAEGRVGPNSPKIHHMDAFPDEDKVCRRVKMKIQHGTKTHPRVHQLTRPSSVVLSVHSSSPPTYQRVYLATPSSHAAKFEHGVHCGPGSGVV